MTSQHKRRAHVLFSRYAAADSRLAAAFVRLPRHLPKDPDEHLWRNRRRSSAALHCPARKAVDACRLVMRAAIDTGDTAAVESTALDVETYVEEIKAAALVDYSRWASGLPKLSFPTAGVAAVKELAESLPVVVDALVNRSPAAADAASERVHRAIRTLEEFRTTARRYITNHTVIRAFR